MLAHAKADRHEESLGYWRQLVCLDGVGEMAITPATCQAALKSAVVCNQWEEVETIADMLKVNRWRRRRCCCCCYCCRCFSCSWC